MKFIDKNSTHEEFLSQQFVSFENVRFSYPPVEGDVDQEGNQIIPPVLLDHFTAVLPKGFVSLVGPCRRKIHLAVASLRTSITSGRLHNTFRA